MTDKSQDRSGKLRMTFVWRPTADTKCVSLAGDFNDWDPMATPMLNRNGTFRKTLQLEPGEHQYKFVVDGDWFVDPAAMQVPNDKGTMNSVANL